MAVPTVVEPGIAREIVPRVNPSRDAEKAGRQSAARGGTTKAVAVNATKGAESATRGAVKVVKGVTVVAAGRAADSNPAPGAVKRVLGANASGR